MKETYRSENDFLLSAVRHGDQKAFDTLFRKYYPMLCAYGHRFVDLEDAEVLRRELADADLFCNATKVGMKPMDDQSVIPDVSMLRPELVVSDIVYNPRETKLLKDAKKAGCKVIPGIGMLLWQGAEAFRLYTGQEMPVKEVQERYFSE